MDGMATLLRCDHILVNSGFTADEQRIRSWRSRPITVVPYGTDVRFMSDSERLKMRAAVNAEHSISPDAPVIGMMARFDPWKGIDVSLRAAAPLLRERPELRFVLVGGQYRHFHAEYGEYLRALVAHEGIAGQVIFAGFRMDVRPYLARMTVLVHSSRQPEPFGLTIIEAMASGVPVVAARGGGAAEIVEPGVDGLLHTPGNETELREELRVILDKASLRMAFSAAGLRKVDERYRPASMMQIIEAVYDEVIGSPATETGTPSYASAKSS
jgi:glycosyltransferase involved in cell wall biosynthesis